MKVDFLDLKREYNEIKLEVDAAIKRVFERGHYILGPELVNFENKFSAYNDVRYAIGVSSGTEAIHLALVACGVRPKDEVITAVNTCGPTISAIIASGAIPVLADVNPGNFCFDIVDVRRKITDRTKAVVPVHLYGNMSNMDELVTLCRKFNILIIEDCAQSTGAKFKNKKAGTWGKAGAFSFYPTKNIGAYGDAGMIVTNDKNIAMKCRLLRNYGQKNKYEHIIVGFNSRLDELQAAILSVKLKKINIWNRKRRKFAKIYCDLINNPEVSLPREIDNTYQVYHLFVTRTKFRDAFQRFLFKNGISTMVHYPIPIYKQKFFRDQLKTKCNFPVADALSKEIVSLPLYPFLKERELVYIIKTVNSFRPGIKCK